jgi:hypothetical protein
MRWVVFDDETAEVVMGKYKHGAAEIDYGDHPLDAALKARSSILLLPAPDPGKVLVARIEFHSTKPCSTSRAPVIAQFTPLRTIGRQSSPSPDAVQSRRQ